jgi:hypothetical protein
MVVGPTHNSVTFVEGVVGNVAQSGSPSSWLVRCRIDDERRKSRTWMYDCGLRVVSVDRRYFIVVLFHIRDTAFWFRLQYSIDFSDM